MNQQAKGDYEEVAWGRESARVAFFGGSFDPPHLGHLAVARAARAALGLDMVLFAPVGAQPLKPERSAASFEDRLAMTRLAIEGEPGFEVSLADAPKPARAPNFTLETLQAVRDGLGSEGVLFCLMGADSFFGLRQWHRAAEIPFVAPLIVASRPGEQLDELQAAMPEGLKLEPAPDASRNESGVEVRAYRVVSVAGASAPLYVLPGLHVNISATEIRRSIREKRRGAGVTVQASQKLVPKAIADYVQAHGLYSEPD